MRRLLIYIAFHMKSHLQGCSIVLCSPCDATNIIWHLESIQTDINVRNPPRSVLMCRRDLQIFSEDVFDAASSFSLLLGLLPISADSSQKIVWNEKKENKRKILGKFIIWFLAVSQLEWLTCAFRHRRWWYNCQLWTICTPRPPYFAEVSSQAEFAWHWRISSGVSFVRLCVSDMYFRPILPCASVSCSYDSAFNYLSFGGSVHSIKISSFHFSFESTVEFSQKKYLLYFRARHSTSFRGARTNSRDWRI